MIGKTLGHYQITDKLGEGGMGVVYKARDTHLDRFIALKILPPDKVADPERKRRFVQEAKAASALNHPNIVHVYDIDQSDGADFIAMEYVDGKTLDQRIGHRGLRLIDALKYAVQIADALAKAHSAGIVHRDLKPTNIMVNEDGVVKVLDFGLAKLTEQIQGEETDSTATVDGEGRPITEEGVIVGTVSYMSPEQAEGKKVDPRSDVFSLGSVLYEMVTGQKAFQGTSKMSTLSAILHQEPKPVSGITPTIPADLEKLINRCLRKDPSRRFQHMDDVKVALEELKEESDSGRLSASIAIPPRRMSPWLILTATAVVIGAATGLAWWLLRRPPADAELKLSRFTFDSSLTSGGAISADGKLMAYASDRNDESNLDIYVQQIAGRQAIRITSHPADDVAPSFSPDGSKIVFRSTRDGGGIYVVDTLGGEERKIAGGGFSPSYSPDGSLILYTVMPPAGDFTLNRMYLVPSQGGDPKPFQEEFGVVPMYGGGPVAIWSPDGKFVLFSGARAKKPSFRDWWVAPVTGGEPVSTGAAGNLESAEWAWIYPTVWSANRVIFSAGATHAEGASIYSVPITPGTWKISGPARKLTSGPGLNFAISSALDRYMGIAAMKSVSEICSIPLDPKEGTATGPAQRITRDETSKISPTISRDGSRLAYVAATIQPVVRIEVRLRDTTDGRESAFTARGTGYVNLLPRLSNDGSILAYRDYIAGNWQSFLVAGRAGTAQEVCEGCLIYSFFADPNQAIVQYGNEIVRQNLSTGNRTALVKTNRGRILDVDLSPDGRWLALVSTKPSGGNAIHLVPIGAALASEKEWVLVADEDTVLDSPRWSADGNLLYFVSERDGRPCIWAQRLNPETQQPTGRAFEVYHERRARYIVGPKRFRKISVARDKLVAMMIKVTGDVWLARLGLE